MSSIEIREYRSQDVPGILQLMNEVFSVQQYFDVSRTEQWWKWKYEQNVLGGAIITVVECNQTRGA